MSFLVNASAASVSGALSLYPCWLLSLGALTILLDCSLAESVESTEQRCILPSLDSQTIRSIDIVLISTHDTLLALPFISEFGGFKGQIYATEPTAMFGKLRLEEFLRSNPKIFETNGFSRPCYSSNEARSCISKINRVRFNEVVNIGILTLTAHSSGLCLGSTNWIITYHFQKILYLSATSLTLNKHSAPFDSESIKAADFVIANNSSMTASAQTNHSQILQKSSKMIYSTLARAIETGGTVIFLCKPFGTLFDLLELVETMMGTMGITVVVHVVSNVANESLKVCNILGEWMNKERQDTVFGSNLPLGHGRMIQVKRLITHKSVHTVFSEKPQVLFLDYGELSPDVLSAVAKWRPDKCTYILPDAEIPSQFAPILSTLRFLHCPFNLGASEDEYIKVLKSINPSLGTVIPHGSLAFDQLPNGTICVLSPKFGKFSIPVDSKRQYVRITKSVAQNAELSLDGRWAGVSGVLDFGQLNTLRDDKVIRKVIFGQVGLLERVVDAALIQRDGAVIEKEGGSITIDCELGQLKVNNDRLTVEATEVSKLLFLLEWIKSI